MMSNQRINSYLKEIADLCGIKKESDLSYSIENFIDTEQSADYIVSQ